MISFPKRYGYTARAYNVPLPVRATIWWFLKCFCGGSGAEYDKLGTLSSSDCDYECTNNDEETCGGYYAIQVRKNGQVCPLALPRCLRISHNLPRRLRRMRHRSKLLSSWCMSNLWKRGKIAPLAHAGLPPRRTVALDKARLPQLEYTRIYPRSRPNSRTDTNPRIVPLVACAPYLLLSL